MISIQAVQPPVMESNLGTIAAKSRPNYQPYEDLIL